MELIRVKLSSLSVWHKALPSRSGSMDRSHSFFWLPALFATLIVLFSPQVGFPQLFQPEEKNQIRLIEKRNQIQGIIQLEKLIQRQQFILEGDNIRRIQVQPSIDVPLKNKNLTALNQRFETHLLAQKDWVDHHCLLTAQQDKKYKKLITTKLQVYFKLQKQGSYLPTSRDLLPITFVLGGIGQRMFNAQAWHEQIDALLTKKQQATLNNARQKREAWLRSAVRDHAYVELNKILYFTPEQRLNVEQHLDTTLLRYKSTCYSMRVSNTFFGYSHTLGLLTGFPEEHLSPQQQTVLKQMSPRGIIQRPMPVDLAVPDPQEDVDKKIRSATQQLRQELTHQTMIRFNSMIAYLGLDSAEARHLELAVKGAVHYRLMESKTSALRDHRLLIQRINAGRVGHVNGIQLALWRPHVSSINSHPIIKEAEKSLGPKLDFYEKIIAQIEHEARVIYTVSLLDRELWLTQTQREAFQELIANRLAVQSIDSPAGIYEIVLVAFPLATISDEEIGGILDQSQLAARKELKTHFQFSDNPSVDDSATLKLPRANSKIAFKVPASNAAPATIQPVEAVR